MRRMTGWVSGVLVVLLAVGVVALWVLSPRDTSAPVNSQFRIYRVPKVPDELSTPAAHTAVAAVARMSLTDRIRSLLIVSKPGTSADSLSAFLAQTGAAGFILMKPNIPSTPQALTTMTAQMGGSPEFPRLIAIDEEGGDVTRLPYDTIPGANTLRNEPVIQTQTAFTQRGTLLASVGVNLNFGIVADISADPRSFIFGRSFGSTALSAGERVVAAVTGEKMSSVISTLKHFPGHGAAPGDSHSSIPSTTMSKAQWQATEAVPFQMGVKAGASAVMFGHLAYLKVDNQPASLSRIWHDILRDEIGFTGLAITDDMLMLQRSGVPEFADPDENAVRALNAGNDVLLYVLGDDPASSGVNLDRVVSTITQAVETGRLSEEVINAAALRVMTARRALSTQAPSDTQACNIECTIGYSLLFPYSAHG